MSVKSIPSDQQLLALCQKTCTELRAKYTCMNDHIPQTELPRPLPCDNASQNRYLEKYGNRWVRFIAHVVRRELARAACDQVQLMSAQGMNPYSVFLASTKIGIAECEQITMLACKALDTLSPVLIAIRTTNPKETIGHAFAIVGVPCEEIRSLLETDHVTNIFELLDRFKKGVILDVSLNFVCLVSEYRQKATALIEYATKFQTVEITQATRTSPKSLDITLEEAGEVWKIAQPLVPHCPLNPETGFLKSFANVKVADIMTAAEALIRNRFREVQWKHNHTQETVDWIVWTKGPVAQVQAVGEHLKSIGAKVSADKVKKKEETYAIIFKDPDPLELSVLFATEQIFASAIELPSDKKPGKLANIIARYAEK